MVQFIQKERPDANVFLLGDSMGCNYALNYARHGGNSLAGMVLLAPAFYVDPGAAVPAAELAGDALLVPRAPKTGDQPGG